jgi:ATP-dependent RNA helicase DDX49/DBP8
MAIWKGYQEIKNAAGWAALTFARPSIYRFCKYRMGFDQDAISKLQSLQSRFEVAADTIQPQWRQTLNFVGVSSQRVYRGHPHNLVVGKRKDPVPLAWTYGQWDPDFSFSQIDASVIEPDAFGSYDPRRVASGPHFLCSLCSKPQSENSREGRMRMFR